jgi:hemerythrin superfamily protein
MTQNSTHPLTKDAIDLLMEDHAKVRKLYKQYQKLMKDEASDTEKQEVAEMICHELTVHATVEEELFYPPVRAALDEDDMLDEAEVEHDSAKALIAQIESMDPDDDLYDAKVVVLCEYIDHHVTEEEEEMFPKVRKKSGLDLDQMKIEMLARREELIDAEEGIMEKIKKTIKK